MKRSPYVRERDSEAWVVLLIFALHYFGSIAKFLSKIFNRLE